MGNRTISSRKLVLLAWIAAPALNALPVGIYTVGTFNASYTDSSGWYRTQNFAVTSNGFGEFSNLRVTVYGKNHINQNTSRSVALDASRQGSLTIVPKTRADNLLENYRLIVNAYYAGLQELDQVSDELEKELLAKLGFSTLELIAHSELEYLDRVLGGFAVEAKALSSFGLGLAVGEFVTGLVEHEYTSELIQTVKNNSATFYRYQEDYDAIRDKVLTPGAIQLTGGFNWYGGLEPGFLVSVAGDSGTANINLPYTPEPSMFPALASALLLLPLLKRWGRIAPR